jgi:hypothetical protein
MFSFKYDANGIDLLEMRQTRPGQSELLLTKADYNSPHLPQTLMDTAGKITR